jgi:hypothetical protein
MAEIEQEGTNNNPEHFQQNREAIDAYIRQQFDNFAQSNNFVRAQPTVDADTAQRNAIKEMVDPIYRNELESIRLEARAARDEATFYRKHPEAVDIADDLEKLFVESANNGRPTSREALYDFYNGREQRMNPEKYEARRKAQLERASAASDIGSGSNGKEKAGITIDDFKSLSLEDMERALEGVTF